MREQLFIKKIKKGNQEALDTFIKELYPHVYAFAYRKLQGDDKAKDITQEVFVRFIKQIPMYHCEGKTLHYLYRITSNLCQDHFRKTKREPTFQLDDASYFLQDKMDVHENLIKQICHERLISYMSQLNENQQDIILLKYFHQMTFKEIAEIFDIPLSTIKTRHTAALKQLHHLWKEHSHEDTHPY